MDSFIAQRVRGFMNSARPFFASALEAEQALRVATVMLPRRFNVRWIEGEMAGPPAKADSARPIRSRGVRRRQVVIEPSKEGMEMTGPTVQVSKRPRSNPPQAARQPPVQPVANGSQPGVLPRPDRPGKGRASSTRVQYGVGDDSDRAGLADADRQLALANLEAVADAIGLAAGVFLAFQDSGAASAADIEEAMELTADERKARIAKLEAELRKAQMELDELDESLPENETTAKAKEANIAEIERELFALNTAQAVADAFPGGRNPDEWRMLLTNAIRAGQLEAIDLVLTILTLPQLGAGLIRAVSGIRGIRGFFSWLFRSKPAPTPKQLPWAEYAEGYRRRFEELKRVIAKDVREPGEFERAVGRLREWVDEYAPISPKL
ncbi:MAG: hypothetical protein L0271_01260 [Gemmatimonadetes bacterium]|nr:hypothetical protein [Gemmatimonadota bacterium]